jgi:hypothetical protein
MQKLTLTFLRIITGASQSVSRWVLLKEAGIVPVQCHWIVTCVKFWNANTDKDMKHCAVYSAFEDNVKLFCDGNDSCWSAKFLTCHSSLGLTGGLSVRALRGSGPYIIMGMKFSVYEVKRKIMDHYKQFSEVEATDPRTAPSRGAALVRYTAWFDDKSGKHLTLSAPEAYLKTLVRFRIGCTPLRIHDHRLQRNDRFCSLCSTQCLEDEKHFVFECPAYADLRRASKWSPLYSANGLDMKTFMNQDNQYLLACFLHELLKYRELRLAGMVAWNLDTFSSTSEDSA